MIHAAAIVVTFVAVLTGGLILLRSIKKGENRRATK